MAKLTGRPETADLELEFYGKDGVIRSQVGWRVVTMMSESATTLRDATESFALRRCAFMRRPQRTRFENRP